MSLRRKPRPVPGLCLHALESRDVPLSLPPGFIPSDAVTVATDTGRPPIVRFFDPGPYQIQYQYEVRPFEATFTGGVQVAVAEVTGDRYPDLVVGAGVGGGPVVKIYDGRTGLEALAFTAYEESFRGGVSVAVGDTDGDLVREIIVGAGVGGGPRVRVFDVLAGPDGSFVRTVTGVSVVDDFFAYEESFRGGVEVAGGDLDGDGTDEVICGTGVGGGPRVRAIDARTGAEVMNVFAFEDGARFGVRVAAGDVDGDARDDVVCGSGPGGGPRVRAVRRDGSTSADFFAFDPSDRGGVRVGTVDVEHNYFEEILAGSGSVPLVRRFDAAGSRLDERSPFGEGVGGVQVSGYRLGYGVFTRETEYEGTTAAVDPAARTVDIRQEFDVGTFFSVVRARPDTEFFRDGEPVSLADVRPGDRLVVASAPNNSTIRIEAFAPAE